MNNLQKTCIFAAIVGLVACVAQPTIALHLLLGGTWFAVGFGIVYLSHEPRQTMPSELQNEIATAQAGRVVNLAHKDALYPPLFRVHKVVDIIDDDVLCVVQNKCHGIRIRLLCSNGEVKIGSKKRLLQRGDRLFDAAMANEHVVELMDVLKQICVGGCSAVVHLELYGRNVTYCPNCLQTTCRKSKILVTDVVFNGTWLGPLKMEELLQQLIPTKWSEIVVNRSVVMNYGTAKTLTIGLPSDRKPSGIVIKPVDPVVLTHGPIFVKHNVG